MTTRLLLTAVQTAVAALAIPGISSAATTTPDPFYQYTDSTPLSSIAPGTVLKTRTISIYILGIKTSMKATQLMYRSTDALQRPSTNITTVILPKCTTTCPNKDKVISYQSFYDSLNPEDSPSRAFAGGKRLPDLVPGFETLLFSPYLQKGYTIVVSDIEGQKANFAAGPEYGYNTLDSIRAALNSPEVGLSRNAKVAMMGYSGGAIATEWAAELAPSYAPELSQNLIGATFGGVLVSPNHNLDYVSGAPLWGGVLEMAFIGIARSYELDITKYLSDKGLEIYNKMKAQSIVNVLGQYPKVTWQNIIKPEYWDRATVPEYVTSVNKLIMGTGGTPGIPLHIFQGTGGQWEGTKESPVYGKGDGVMLAGDVRELARQYCAQGVKVHHTERPSSHFITTISWLAGAIPWIDDRFAGKPVPENCAGIAPGNSLAPLVYTP
ncbi:MAG: triacylglycerol lipase [Rubrivivax sp.]|nr:MAG: triacylglycerol lipase [Rubrivivax sp.]